MHSSYTFLSGWVFPTFTLLTQCFSNWAIGTLIRVTRRLVCTVLPQRFSKVSLVFICSMAVHKTLWQSMLQLLWQYTQNSVPHCITFCWLVNCLWFIFLYYCTEIMFDHICTSLWSFPSCFYRACSTLDTWMKQWDFLLSCDLQTTSKACMWSLWVIRQMTGALHAAKELVKFWSF